MLSFKISLMRDRREITYYTPVNKDFKLSTENSRRLDDTEGQGKEGNMNGFSSDHYLFWLFSSSEYFYDVEGNQR